MGYLERQSGLKAAEEFRQERVKRIIQKIGEPVKEKAPGTSFSLHILSLESPSRWADISKIENELKAAVRIPFYQIESETNWNIDGFISEVYVGGGDNAYVQWFRDGAIETYGPAYENKSFITSNTRINYQDLGKYLLTNLPSAIDALSKSWDVSSAVVLMSFFNARVKRNIHENDYDVKHIYLPPLEVDRAGTQDASILLVKAAMEAVGYASGTIEEKLKTS